ncbi:MAG: hypothetical protein JRJ56_00940, partial [Deltaproteobacteria bacterium]|nr:hypothetical protein [Deltaproteobacteria bacterium]
EKGFHRFEWLHQDFEGQPFWADVSLTLMSFGDRPVIFVNWRDITAFKDLEKMLIEEREQLAVTLSATR